MAQHPWVNSSSTRDLRSQVAQTETQPLYYYPTGDFLCLPTSYRSHEREYVGRRLGRFSYVSSGVYVLTDRWFTVVHPENENFYFGVIPLHSKQGEITLEDAEFVSIPVGMSHIDADVVIDGDTLVASIRSLFEDGCKVLVIHLDRENQYELYEGFDRSFKPIGLDGNILYSWIRKGPALGGQTHIEEFNIETMKRVALHCDADYDERKVLAKDYDGSRMVLRKNCVTSDVVSLCGDRVYLQLHGLPRVNNICRNGIYYSFQGMMQCLYSTFDGKTYSVNLEPNQQNVPVGEADICHVSDNGTTFWIAYGWQSDTIYLIKYKLYENRHQKSARSSAPPV